VLYVEGPRDRDILEGWARAESARLGRALNDAAVILGGRQPERAVAHFLEQRERRPGLRGLCVLDRDGGGEPIPPDLPGLEVYTWSRRHIESYLLVPAAIQRSLRRGDAGARAARLLRLHLPDGDDEGALRDFDAKRLLARQGPLARELGQPLAPGRIARFMRPEELHVDVSTLIERLRTLLLDAVAVVTLATPSGVR
jgi:hypothetical protein